MALKNKATVAEGFKKDHILSRSKKRLIFYALMISIPCIQFAIFYIYVNINSIALAFQSYVPIYNADKTAILRYDVVGAGFDNFATAWANFTNARAGTMITNSLLLYAGNLIVVMGLALVFSYYIAKKFMFAGFFRVILYMPHVISAVALVVIYKYLVGEVFVAIGDALVGFDRTTRVSATNVDRLAQWGLQSGLLATTAPEWIRFGTILIYNLWVGFGANVMLFTGSMSGIDQSIIESAQLDGVNIIQEFIHIYIPMIWPTFVTFVVTGITGIFSNTMNLIVFNANNTTAPVEVFGYFMYNNSLNSDKYGTDRSLLSYPVLAALGIIITLILVPVTLIVRKLLETYGPRTD